MLHRIHVVARLLAGCASDGVEASTTYDPLAPFPTRASYTWDDRANKLPPNPRIEALDLDPLIKQAAAEELAVRGYRAAT